jgi:hypothetical protein
VVDRKVFGYSLKIKVVPQYNVIEYLIAREKEPEKKSHLVLRVLFYLNLIF